MRLLVSGLGGKHECECEPATTIGQLKRKLEPSTGMEAAAMKLLVKGKSPEDSATVSGLGLADGGKIMLMRSQLGAKAAAPTPPKGAAPAWPAVGDSVLYVTSGGEQQPAVVRAVHTDDPSGAYYTILPEDGAERQTPGDRLRRPHARPTVSSSPATPAEVGAGPVTLTVTQGKRQLLLRCEASSTVGQCKAMLSTLVDGGEPGSMRLLVKGKEAADASTVESLGLAGGGRMMLLFRERHHREQDGAAAVRDCAALLVDLRARIEQARQRMTKRLLSGAEALAQLGELDSEVSTLVQDLHNARPNEAAEAGRLRQAQLTELEALAEELREARRVEADAELRGQLGR